MRARKARRALSWTLDRRATREPTTEAPTRMRRTRSARGGAGRAQAAQRQAVHSYRMQLLDDTGIKPRRASKWNHMVVGRIMTGRRCLKKSATARRIERATAEWLESVPGE